MLCEAVLSNKARGKFARAAVAQRLAGDQFAGDEQFRCMLFVFLVCFSLCFFFLVVIFFHLLNCLYLNPQIVSLLPF